MMVNVNILLKSGKLFSVTHLGIFCTTPLHSCGYLTTVLKGNFSELRNKRVENPFWIWDCSTSLEAEINYMIELSRH